MTTLELLEEQETESGSDDGPWHAWCIACQDAAAPKAIPSMCGAKVKSRDETTVGPLPDDLCVVCNDLAARPCEKCGA